MNGLLARLAGPADAIEELGIEDIDVDNPAFEALLVGRKVKVLLQDVDRIKWRQDLTEDRNRLATLLSNARAIDRERDAKLAALCELIAHKIAEPINSVDGRPNRKLIVFTAFAGAGFPSRPSSARHWSNRCWHKVSWLERPNVG